MLIRVIRSLLVPLNAIRAAWALWSEASRWTKLVLVATSTYGVVFSVLTILRVYALSSFAYDLGIYHQSLYTTVFNHRFFYYTVDLPSNPSGSIFGVHFSPILVLLLIPYALVPSIFTLTVLQTWAIALAAVPLYLLGRRTLNSERIAFVISIAYLLHPATQGVNWYDFHPEAFLPLAFASGLYFLERREWKAFLLCIGFALSTIEVAAFLVATVATGFLLASFWSAKQSRRSVDRVEVRVLLFLLALSAVWLILGRAVELDLNPQNPYYAGSSGYWSVLGAPGLLDVLFQFVASPGRAFAALSFDAPAKLWYIVVLFGPVLFLPLRSPRALWFCSPWIAVSLLSNNAPFYSIGDQYPAFVLPFILYGAMEGIAKPWRIPPRVRTLVHAIFRKASFSRVRIFRGLPLLTTTIAFLVVVSPFGPFGVAVYRVGGFPSIGYHEAAVDSLYNLIPRSGSVLTQNNLFPLVSDRPNSFIVPFGTLNPPGTPFNSTMKALVVTVDYVLSDYQTSATEGAVMYEWTNRSGGFTVIGAADGAVLLQRGSSTLKLFTPFVRSYDDSVVLVRNGNRVADPTAQGGTAALHSENGTSDFWFGPYVQLSPGAYEVSYRLRVDNLAAGPIIELPVIEYPLELVGTIFGSASTGTRTGFELRLLPGRSIITDLRLNSSGVPAPGEYFWLTQSFVADALGSYEFPGLAGMGSAGLWFDGLRIEQRVAFGSAQVPVSWVLRDWPSS